jgi:hypothetical protein
MNDNFIKELIDSVWEKNLEQYLVGQQSGYPYCPGGIPEFCAKKVIQDPGHPNDTASDAKRRSDILKDPGISEKTRERELRNLDREIELRNNPPEPGWGVLATEEMRAKETFERMLNNERMPSPGDGPNPLGYKSIQDGDPVLANIPGATPNTVGPEGTPAGLVLKLNDSSGKLQAYGEGYYSPRDAIKQSLEGVVPQARLLINGNPKPQSVNAPEGSKLNPNTQTAAQGATGATSAAAGQAQLNSGRPISTTGQTQTTAGGGSVGGRLPLIPRPNR